MSRWFVHVYNSFIANDTFVGSQFTCIGVDLANAQIIFQPYFAEEHQIFGRKNMQVQFLILKLADFDSLEICLYSEMENHRCLLRLMELSQILKGSFVIR